MRRTALPLAALAQCSFEARLVEATSLASGAPAALRECTRINGGWRALVVAAIVGQTGYAIETFPTNLPLLELALEVPEGRRKTAHPFYWAPFVLVRNGGAPARP